MTTHFPSNHRAPSLLVARSPSIVELPGDSIEPRVRESAREGISNAEDIVSTYERLNEKFPAPEVDEVAGPVLEPPEYVTSKQIKEEACEARDEAGEEDSKGSRGRDSAPESLRSTIVFSVAVVAIIAIAKRLRET